MEMTPNATENIYCPGAWETHQQLLEFDLLLKELSSNIGTRFTSCAWEQAGMG